MRLYRNQGDGTFADVTQASRLNVPLYGMGMAAADYDNDGDQDLVITGYQHTRLFRNNGDRTFTDISVQAGIVQGDWSTAAMFVDVDRDGQLDLLLGNYVQWEPHMEEGLDCTYGTPHKDYCAVTYFPGQGLRLYRNLGSGHFRDVTAESGLMAPTARVLGLTMIDANQDGWPDVLVAADLTPSLFFLNQGDGTFREIGVPSGLVLDAGGVAFAGMGIDAAYINNDDQLCVAIGNFSGQPTTLHCQARVGETYDANVFLEQSHQAGLAQPTLRMVTFGLFFFDADLDGWQDLFMLNGHVVNEERLRHVPYMQPPQLFRNRGNGTFTEVVPEPQTGLDVRLIGRGAAYADYDQDGDLDLLLTANQGSAYVLRNDTPHHGAYLQVMTEGSRSNRDGIGARVRLYTTRRRLSGMVRTGGSYLSQSQMALTFGLPSDESIDRLEVLWPSGLVDIFRSLPTNTTFVAREGASGTGKSVAQQPPAPAGWGKLPALKQTAMTHFQAGRLEAATAAFQQVLQQQPNDYITQQYLIELFWRQGRHEQAQALLTTMSQTLPDANFLMQFAFHLEDNTLPDLADAVYRVAARLDPHAPEALYRLGEHALAAGDYETAIADFQQALQRQDGLPGALQGLGLAYAAQGKTAQAEAQFQKVIQQQPDFAEAYTHLGKLYLHSGRLTEALAAYRNVVRLQPERAQSYHNLGTVLVAQGATDAAIQQFREALKRDPRYMPAYNDLGTLYAEHGDLEQAIAAFQAALRLQPSAVAGHYNLAMAYGTQGDIAGMIRELQATLQLAPDHVEAMLNLGIGYLQQGQADLAMTQFRSLISTAPQMADAYYLLAVAAAQQGQEETMRTALEQTLQRDPNHARAHSALAMLYFQHQDYTLAWQHGKKAEQLGAPVQPFLDALRKVSPPPAPLPPRQGSGER
jgi:tetratricopeptide (TPR) repeat protein